MSSGPLLPDDGTEAIESQVEQFLRQQLPAAWVRAIDTGDAEGLSAARDELDLPSWWIALADTGYVTPSWPAAYGGLGLSGHDSVEVSRTLSRYKVPRFTNPVGLTQAGSAILQWGSEEQKQRFLRPIARHQEIWCQLFSEPGAGSDLAGLATRAVPDGGVWHIHGQKVWTTLGHLADFGLLLARTSPGLPKHQGITAFLLPMHQAGVDVRPLANLTGEVHFNEVFIDDAVVDDAMRIGDVNAGWQVAVSVLMGERQAGGGRGGALPGTVTGRSVESLIRRHSPIRDPLLRQRMAQAFIEDKLVEITNQRIAARIRAGRGAGPEGSMMKLFHSEHTQRLHDLATDLEGAAGQAWPADDRWLQGTAWSFLRVRSKTISGGTSEIQRNVLGERVLGLPKEPEVDRNIPWSEVRR